MANDCSACCSKITGNAFMECSNEKCRKKYDLKCLKIAFDAFKALTIAYKKKWVCPECVCLNPKGGNTETPVRSAVGPSSAFGSPPLSNVNMQRGSQARFSPIMLGGDTDSELLTELRKFHSDIVTRLDGQAKTISLLQNEFSETKSELTTLVKIIKVIEEKVNSKFINQSQELGINVVAVSPGPSEVTVSQNTDLISSHKKNANSQKPTKPQKVNKGGATKSVVLQVQADDTSPPTNQSNDKEQEHSNWTTVKNKKSSRLSKIIGVGRNTELKAIVATERRKYLHVWRLHPDTTSEALTDHVKNICGQDVSVEIDKITHKSERGYSSFRIGVPDRIYEELSNADNWPMNAEFNEWIWFRRSTKKSSSQK